MDFPLFYFFFRQVKSAMGYFKKGEKRMENLWIFFRAFCGEFNKHKINLHFGKLIFLTLN